jgi:hypothetical protein
MSEAIRAKEIGPTNEWYWWGQAKNLMEVTTEQYPIAAIARGMPEHVRVHRERELRGLAGLLDHPQETKLWWPECQLRCRTRKSFVRALCLCL